MKPIVIYENNQNYLFISKNPIFHVHTKHIEIHHHLVQKKSFKDFIELVYCNTKKYVCRHFDQGTFC
jgi:hypothetical protein